MLDLQSIKSYMTPLGMTIGQCNLSVAATASVGGFTYGLLGSKTYSNDILVSLFICLGPRSFRTHQSILRIDSGCDYELGEFF